MLLAGDFEKRMFLFIFAYIPWGVPAVVLSTENQIFIYVT